MRHEIVRGSVEVTNLLHAFGSLRTGEVPWTPVGELAGKAAGVAGTLARALDLPVGSVIEALGRTVDAVVRADDPGFDPIPALYVELIRAAREVAS